MRAPRQESLTLAAESDTIFLAALGVAQSDRANRILAVHRQGAKLVLRSKAKMSNPKLVQVWVDELGNARTLHVMVGSDPRTQAAILDGWANGKALKKFLEAVQGALDGSAPAPASPVANFYLHKKVEVPWVDPTQSPDIELDGGFLAT